jgi:hypothetical protein
VTLSSPSETAILPLTRKGSVDLVIPVSSFKSSDRVSKEAVGWTCADPDFLLFTSCTVRLSTVAGLVFYSYSLEGNAVEYSYSLRMGNGDVHFWPY